MERRRGLHHTDYTLTPDEMRYIKENLPGFLIRPTPDGGGTASYQNTPSGERVQRTLERIIKQGGFPVEDKSVSPH